MIVILVKKLVLSSADEEFEMRRAKSERETGRRSGFGASEEALEDVVRRAIAILKPACGNLGIEVPEEQRGASSELLIGICTDIARGVSGGKSVEATEGEELRMKLEEARDRISTLEERCQQLESDLAVLVCDTAAYDVEKSSLARRLEAFDAILTEDINAQKRLIQKVSMNKQNQVSGKQRRSPRGNELLSPGFAEELGGHRHKSTRTAKKSSVGVAKRRLKKKK
jgi:hypothetical protein